MKSKTQIITLCLLMFASIQFVSCKKDNSTVTTVNRSGTVDNAITDSITDSSLLKNLVAWYTFNGDVLDHSGHHNNVVFNSATPTRGKAGVAKTAYKFDGIANYMQVANSKSLNPQRISLYA